MTKNDPDLSRTSSFFRSVLCMVIASSTLLTPMALADHITPVGIICFGAYV